MRFIQVKAPHFTAGADVMQYSSGGVVSTHPYGVAPIIKYMAGWDFAQVRDYCKSKGWDLAVYEKLEDKSVRQLWPKT